MTNISGGDSANLATILDTKSIFDDDFSDTAGVPLNEAFLHSKIVILD